MRGRIAALVVVATMVGALFAVQGAQVAGADDHDPIGYTIGQNLTGGPGRSVCNFYKIDLKTGAATQVNPVGQPVTCADGLTYDDDGTLYAYRVVPSAGGIVNAQLITIDKHTGAQHLVGALPPVNVGRGGMTFDADGDLWLYAVTTDDPQCQPDNTTCLWEVNPKTAAAEFVGAAPLGIGVLGLAADCEEVLAISQRLSGGVVNIPAQLNELDTHNAALHKIADVAIPFPTGLDFDDENDLWAIGFTNTPPPLHMAVYRVDPDNGNIGDRAVTLNGVPFSGILNGLAVSPLRCEDPETPTTTAPPAPVIAAEPLFTG